MPHPVRTGVDPPRRLLALHGVTGAEALAEDAAALIARLPTPASCPGSPPVVGLYPLDLDGDVAFAVGVEAGARGSGTRVRVSPGVGGGRHAGTRAPDHGEAGRGGRAGSPALGGDARRRRPAGRPGRPVVHVDPHDELPLAWFPLLAWARERGHDVGSVVRERYRDDPATTDPHHLRTEITITLDTPGDPA